MKNITTALKVILITMISMNYSLSQNNNYSKTNEKLVSHTTISYRLFPTNNENTFIKLNTQNGVMSQVQIDIEEENRYETFINTIPLVVKENEVNERFTLHRTYNIYTFILLDQIDGRMWQVYWSDKAEERGIVPIYKTE